MLIYLLNKDFTLHDHSKIRSHPNREFYPGSGGISRFFLEKKKTFFKVRSEKRPPNETEQGSKRHQKFQKF